MSHYAARNTKGHHKVHKNDPAAIAHLKREHHKFRKLVDKINAAKTPGAKRDAAVELHLLLARHIAMEEELFYPAVKSRGLTDEVKEGLVEHDIQRFLSAQIEAMKLGDPLYGARLGVLGELLVHHIDEEDDEMFQEAKRLGLNLDAMNDRLEAREHELKAQIAKTGRVKTPRLDAEVRARNAV
jgi:hemerythrin-like domain-containing protein